MAEYTTTSLITISPFNNPLRYVDIDEYSSNIAPDHHIRVLKTVDASNAAIDDAECDEICWGYRYSRGIGLDIEYTRMADEAFADVNPSTIQVSYSHVTLIFQMRFFQGSLKFIACGSLIKCYFRYATRESESSIGESSYPSEGGGGNRM